MNKLAIVCCLHSMWRMAPAFVAYHRALGVSRFFFYMDRCPREAHESLADYPEVAMIDVEMPRDGESASVLPLRCLDDALRRCRTEKFDWLLPLDVDECAWGGGRPIREGPAIPQGSLQLLLDDVPEQIEQIILRTLEMVPRP